MLLPEEVSTFRSKDILGMTGLHRPFNYKSLKDWLLVGIMSIPLIVLSIFGVMFLIQLSSLPN